MIFSSNAVRQFYVVPSTAQVSAVNTKLAANAVRGSLAPQNKAGKKEVWFEYASPNFKGIVRTDLIKKENITNIVYKTAAQLQKVFNGQIISLDANINGGAPIRGQGYIFRVRTYGLGVGGNDIQFNRASGVYTPITDAQISSGTGALNGPSLLYHGLAYLFNKSIEKEPEQWFKVVPLDALGAAIDTSGVTYNPANPTVAAVSIGVFPIVRQYVRGKKQGEPLRFEVSVVPVKWNGLEVLWANSDSTTSVVPKVPGLYLEDGTFIPSGIFKNGRTTADMEWFYYGERGDNMRSWAYPHDFNTEYLAIPGKGDDIEYGMLEIEFHYKGPAEDVQRSTKQITIAAQVGGTYGNANNGLLQGLVASLVI